MTTRTSSNIPDDRPSRNSIPKKDNLYPPVRPSTHQTAFYPSDDRQSRSSTPRQDNLYPPSTHQVIGKAGAALQVPDNT
ncbi:hypothetical protein MAR_021001 [Mya arenaria]|uniref:Uncharacterized protein n=1 Tax=Mya arenaria TaxID=6604 RepID=A0ABY7E6I8_MYAAR|nr:hypothetical protein MAR_021001 [Mya arenaria]